ncbi:hypothetical protein WM40_22830 [Robbsia andropogonis]|uniref:Uncharacterized protein n=1 Tax=Robbsia andropogonis TaxID=28092 RepID=A0A0F5JUH6_9BURK|nr:hypothetical protein WM40_22830 [Robbsia andropogonis]
MDGQADLFRITAYLRRSVQAAAREIVDAIRDGARIVHSVRVAWYDAFEQNFVMPDRSPASVIDLTQ